RTIPLSGNVACPSISILGSLPGGVVGVPYSQLLTGNGGTAPYVFTRSGGVLPAALGLASGGTVSGVPTTAGSSSATIKATDSNGCFAQTSFTIAIIAATVTAAPTSLGFGGVTVGSPVTLPVTITNTSAFAVLLMP